MQRTLKEKFKLTELWLKLALLFLFAAFYVFAQPFPEKARQFPQLVAVIGLGLTILALILDFARGGTPQGEISGVDETELQVLDERTQRSRRQRYYRAWAIIIASTVAGMLGGFFFCALGLVGGFSVLFGSRESATRNTLAGLGIVAAVYLVFGRLMGVPLFSGLLW